MVEAKFSSCIAFSLAMVTFVIIDGGVVVDVVSADVLVLLVVVVAVCAASCSIVNIPGYTGRMIGITFGSELYISGVRTSAKYA